MSGQGHERPQCHVRIEFALKPIATGLLRSRRSVRCQELTRCLARGNTATAFRGRWILCDGTTPIVGCVVECQTSTLRVCCKGSCVVCSCGRRAFLGLASGGVGFLIAFPGRAADLVNQQEVFVAEAHRMKQLAIDAGDQPFGAIVIQNGLIVGYGPSRVTVDRNPDAHAERVAIWDAQKQLGTEDLSGAAMYSTSKPCLACENAAANANLDRMFFGPLAADAGRPRRG